MIAQVLKCLYCVWPGLIFLLGGWLFKLINVKTFYGALTPGVDPVSPQGQEEFETRRQRDAEKRRVIYWLAGACVLGWVGIYLVNVFSVPVQAAPGAPTVTTGAPTMAQAGELSPSSTPTPPTAPQGSPVASLTPTYAPTATDRIMVITQIVTVEIPVPVVITEAAPPPQQ